MNGLSNNAMFGDDDRTTWQYIGDDWVTYVPTYVQWEVARQMNADFVRLRNQEGTIAQLQSDLAASRAECERYREAIIRCKEIAPYGSHIKHVARQALEPTK